MAKDLFYLPHDHPRLVNQISKEPCNTSIWPAEQLHLKPTKGVLYAARTAPGGLSSRAVKTLSVCLHSSLPFFGAPINVPSIILADISQCAAVSHLPSAIGRLSVPRGTRIESDSNKLLPKKTAQQPIAGDSDFVVQGRQSLQMVTPGQPPGWWPGYTKTQWICGCISSSEVD